MKPKATIQWTLAFLLLASCMQAQSIWNTAHLANCLLYTSDAADE